MTLIRLFKSKEGQVTVDLPAGLYQHPEGVKHCKIPEKLKGQEMLIIDRDAHPELLSLLANSFTDGANRTYCDGELSVKNMQFDEKWERTLMPLSRIKVLAIKEILKRLQKIEENDEFDSKEVFLLQRKLSKIKMMRGVEVYELAIERLDARVKGGEDDKPSIRKKLKAKIKELKKTEKETLQ